MKESSRLTVDMSHEQHMYLKMASAKLGLTMRDFVIEATFKMLEEIEDEWLSQRASEVLKKIELGEEKTSSWPAAKKRLHKK